MYFILIIRVNDPARIMVHKSLKVKTFYYSIGTNTQVVIYFAFLAYLTKKKHKVSRNKASVALALAVSRVCLVSLSVISLYLQRNS